MSTPNRFLPHGVFFQDLNRRVDAHFADTATSPRAPRSMWVKTAVMVAWFIASWGLLVFVAQTAWQALLASTSLGLAMTGIGFNVMHDGGHRAYSARVGVNRAMALMLDVLGGSSYVWNWKHNVHHHTNPNVAGLDVDIDIQPLVRLSPEQPWHPWHRLQFLYTWPLYSLLAIKWHFVDDFHDLLFSRIGNQPFPPPKGFDLLAVVLGKVLFFSYAVVIPLLVHPWWVVFAGYLATSVVLSLSLALTFQAAHCVPLANAFDPHEPVEWAVHQARTSVDFAPGHPLWTWYLGGLNYQLEHHLFPRVCHVHYAALAPIVREVCLAHQVPYRVTASVSGALLEQLRWLFTMGQRPATTPAAAPAAQAW